MVDKQKLISLTNRDGGRVGYTIPDMGNLHRTFIPGETKMVTYEELEKLSWVDGGRSLLKNYLIIGDKEAAEEILGEIEPEYYYTKDEVRTLLTQGSLEQLQDALEFAPEGVVELIKKEAVELPVNNVAMRKEILNATKFNVDKAIEINEESQETEESSSAATSKRRSTPVAATSQNSTTSRKSEPIQSKYKIIK